MPTFHVLNLIKYVVLQTLEWEVSQMRHLKLISILCILRIMRPYYTVVYYPFLIKGQNDFMTSSFLPKCQPKI